MASTSSSRRTTAYRPALAWFSLLGSSWVFGVVTLGAFTTSIGAGMAFADWPLSNGSLNPEGWLTNIAKFAEHSHRLFGSVMGLISIVLAVWVWRTDSRRWLRNLGWAALCIVIIQGILGGKRVQLDAMAVPGFEMTLGQMLRIPHGVLAQMFVCILFAITASLSKRWSTPPGSAGGVGGARPPFSPALRRLALAATSLVWVQLVVAAVMRHNQAGLAIPTFPFTPEGGLIPSSWNFGVAIHFTHRVMALALSCVLPWLVVSIWRSPTASTGYKQASGALLVILIAQVSLGVGSVWSARNPYYTTAHVIVGACLLALTFSLAWWTHRDVLTAPETVR
jgi:heme a synthase